MLKQVRVVFLSFLKLLVSHQNTWNIHYHDLAQMCNSSCQSVCDPGLKVSWCKRILKKMLSDQGCVVYMVLAFQALGCKSWFRFGVCAVICLVAKLSGVYKRFLL